MAAWWFEPLWKLMEFVSWEYDIPNIWKSKKMFQTTIPRYLINHY